MESYSVNLTAYQWDLIIDQIEEISHNIRPGDLKKGKDKDGDYVIIGQSVSYNDQIQDAMREYNEQKATYDLWLNMKRRIQNKQRAQNVELSKLKQQIKDLKKQNQELEFEINRSREWWAKKGKHLQKQNQELLLTIYSLKSAVSKLKPTS